MTDSELQQKRERGICYQCDNKWSPGHRCRKKELNELVTCDEADEPEANSDPEVKPDPELDVAKLNQVIEVSLNSVVGLTNPKTMKIRGTIGDQDVVALINTRATQFHFRNDGEQALPAGDSHRVVWRNDGVRRVSGREGDLPGGQLAAARG